MIMFHCMYVCMYKHDIHKYYNLSSICVKITQYIQLQVQQLMPVLFGGYVALYYYFFPLNDI
jgi:hypothetical protein